jgi:hypothetical protein
VINFSPLSLKNIDLQELKMDLLIPYEHILEVKTVIAYIRKGLNSSIYTLANVPIVDLVP